VLARWWGRPVRWRAGVLGRLRGAHGPLAAPGRRGWPRLVQPVCPGAEPALSRALDLEANLGIPKDVWDRFFEVYARPTET